VKNNTSLFLVLKKVPIEEATHFVLFKDQAFTESNEQRTDRLLQPNPVKTTAKMVWQLVPCYPGMPTENNPYGSNTNPNNLCPDEIEFYDLDEPLYDFSLPPGPPPIPPGLLGAALVAAQAAAAAALPGPPPGFPPKKNGVKKAGHVMPIGVCFQNNAYKSGSVYNDGNKFWRRDFPFIAQQPKIHMYGWSQ
jgi:hypothetical protein